MATVEEFLAQVKAIDARKPGYKLGHIGDDGWCDCIGLIMGALKRCGISWVQATKSGAIHGSNWAARYALVERFPEGISDASQLRLGDLVFKYIEPGKSGYALPTRYREGKANDVGVYMDYMHVGVVTGVNPLRITHCSGGGMHLDTTLGKWRARGRLKILEENGEKQTAPVQITPEPVAHKTVRNGSRGDEVKRAQALLNVHGFGLVEDGIFGKLTEKATRDYQRSKGLTVDGIIGPMTWAALEAEGGASNAVG